MKESLELFSRTMNENPEVKEFLNGDKEITFKPIIDLTGSTCNNTYYDKEAFQKALTDKDNVPPQKIMIIGDNDLNAQMSYLNFRLDDIDLVEPFLTLPVSREPQITDELNYLQNLDFDGEEWNQWTPFVKKQNYVGYKDNKKRKKRMLKKRQK